MLTGEAIRTLDQRLRLSLPAEMAGALGAEALIAKERPGCVSLWPRAGWEQKQQQTAEIIRQKLASGRLDARLGDVQRLGRLLSTRERTIPIAGRGRLVIPEGFRDFLGVDAGGEVVVVGAAVCVELWRPSVWAEVIGQEMPAFRDLLEDLAR
ncbi:division/cell wall cluster transcriptional repressor MraZ [Botrimarina sp.]|uniref:division/cell wall cluster transcriptional repressor MraZ n=1 Tax=Botrimarina sp. TaxID=2795802 RepID=UPI0032EB28DD